MLSFKDTIIEENLSTIIREYDVEYIELDNVKFNVSPEGLIFPSAGGIDKIGYEDHYIYSPDGYSPSQFISYVKKGHRLEIYLNTTARFDNAVQVDIQYEDYPGMITDLEKHGVITTTESKSFICTDPRTFHYKSQSYEVDCLGTSLCQDISDMIVSEWNKLKI